MTAYAIQAVKVNNTAYAGVVGTQFDRARQFLSEGSDGTVHETHHAVIQAKPVVEFTTVAMKTMLSALGTSGTADFPLVALDGVNGIVMYGAKAAANAPGYNASAVHMTKTALNGVVVMEGVKWSLGSAAQMMLKGFLISSNGTTDPVSTATTAALPTQSTNAEAFTLSAVTLNGNALDSVESVELTVDHKFDQDFSTGLPYPIMYKGAGPNGRAAIRLAVDARDVELSEGTGAVSVVFTNLAQGGTLGANTVTFTFNGPWSLEETIQGGNGSPMTKRLVTRPYYNGTTKPLTWAVV